MTLVLFRRLNTKMVIPITTAMPMCTFLRIFTTVSSDLPFVPRMSTVKEVVSAVSAEPAADDNATGTDGGTDTGDTTQQTEPAEPAEPEVTVADAVAGFYGGQLSLVDVLSAFNTEMPIIPICYRSGVTVTKSYLKADNVSSVTDVYFGIQGIMNK